MNNLRDNDLNNGVEKSVDLASLSFFNSDPYFNFVYKKSERLCMAIYLVTDFFPASDSIKDNMRNAGTKLLRVSLSLITSSSTARKDILNELSGLCLEIISLSKVSSNLGMTSIANHNVLEGEIKNFIATIEEKERPSTVGQGFVLNEEILSCEIEKTPTAVMAKVNEPQSSYYHIEDKREVKVNVPVHANNQIPVEKKVVHTLTVNKVDLPKKHDQATEAEGVEVPTRSVMQKNERQQIILDIIKEIGESSIKDISDNIKDCSEKTIQRELNTLIYDGVLKKIGERRWSKYIIA